MLSAGILSLCFCMLEKVLLMSSAGILSLCFCTLEKSCFCALERFFIFEVGLMIVSG